MNKASIRVESLVIPTYPEPAKEEMPLFAEYRVHPIPTRRRSTSTASTGRTKPIRWSIWKTNIWTC